MFETNRVYWTQRGDPLPWCEIEMSAVRIPQNPKFNSNRPHLEKQVNHDWQQQQQRQAKRNPTRDALEIFQIARNKKTWMEQRNNKHLKKKTNKEKRKER